MFCTQCGKEISNDARFCPHCGSPTGGAPTGRGARAGATGAKAGAPAAGPADGCGAAAGAGAESGDGTPEDITTADGSASPSAAASGAGAASTPEADGEPSGDGTDASQAAADAGASHETANGSLTAAEPSAGASQNTSQTTAAPSAAVGTSTSQATVSQAAATPAPSATTGDISAQVAEARKSAKRKMPLFLLVVLVALGIATAAFAATLVWRYVIAPAIEARQEVVVEAVTEAPAESEPAATTEAATTEPEIPEPETTDDTAAQQAVFNDILAEYKAAQDGGWASTDSELFDLSSLVNLQSTEYYSQTYPVDNIAYAYTDLGNDGILDLVIANVNDDGTYTLYGAFPSNGTQAYQIGEAGLSLGVKYVHWSALSDGTLCMTGGYSDVGAFSRTTYIYSVSDGTAVKIDEYLSVSDGNGANANYTYSHNGQDITKEEYEALLNSQQPAALDWHPLSEFSPVEP